MADASETMKYLVSEFETAPAGTREEALMAKALSESIHMHGLETANEDFTYATWNKPVRAIALALAGVFGILGGMRAGGVLAFVMLLLSAVCAAIYLFETTGNQVVSRMLGKGYSQNVVARHPGADVPGAAPDQPRPRPIVVIAHYDTPRADIMAAPVLRMFAPYLERAIRVSLLVIIVTTLLQLIPFPHALKGFLWAVAIVAAAVVIFGAVRLLLNSMFLRYTNGANDNMSGVAALLGLLDRVRPAMGSDLVSLAQAADEGHARDAREDASRDAEHASVRTVRRGAPAADHVERPASASDDARRAPAAQDAPVAPASPSRRERRAANAPVRRGADVLRSLGMVPPTCEIIYEGAPVAAAPDASAPHAPVPAALTGERRAAQAPSQAAQAPARTDDDATTVASRAASPTTPAQAPAPSDPGATTVVTPVTTSSAPADAVPSGEATSVLTPAQLSQAMRQQRVAGERAPEETQVVALPEVPAQADAAQPAPAAQAPAQAPAPAQAAPARKPLNVLISSDEPDSELLQSPAALPRDVAEQQGVAMSDEARRDSILNNPKWGTTSFTPVTQTRRVIEDLPDPAVAAVDPFSVSSIETIGDFDPDDFSAMNFETGTHTTLTPAMLEDYKRDNLDGFDDFAQAGDKKSRRGKRNKRPERISQRAAEMQQQMQEQSFTDWLGVDSNYNARTNGSKIGTWDNFSDDASAAGAAPAGRQDPSNGTPDPSQWSDGTGAAGDSGDRRWKGGAVPARRGRDADGEGRPQASELRDAAMSLGDAELVSHEIWFVLTGASEEQQAGMKAFLAEYDTKLHNACFVNLECVGAGRQSIILEEGDHDRRKADRRMVNLIGNASQDLGRPLAMARMGWRDTDATPALRRGRHAVTLCGMRDGVPAYARTAADVAQNVSASKVNDIVDIVAEFIRRA